MRFKKTFSRKDLLAIIVCAFFLSAVMGSVGKIGRENAKRMVCANNINQLLQGLMFLAGENEGFIPENTSGFWPWDMEYHQVNSLLENIGIDVSMIETEPGEDIPIHDVFYCPSNIPQKKARDIYWKGSVDPEEESGYRTMGYMCLWAAKYWNNHGSLPVEGSGDKKYVKTIYIGNPAETELLVDAVMSDMKNWCSYEYPNGNFAKIASGAMPVLYGIYDSSSHLINDKEPSGGNIGFVAGHVAWRPFVNMEKRWKHFTYCPVAWW